MDLDHLRTFLAIYRHGSMTHASKILHLSQPAISQQLKALEAEIGRPLFVRGARGVAPTPLAHALANETADHVDALVGASAAFRSGADALEATITIGGPADCLGALILPTLTPLINQGLRVIARSGLTKDLIARLADGELDLVVATTPSRRAGVRLTALFDETIVLAVNPNVARKVDRQQLANGDPSSLHHLPIVAFSDSLPLLRRYWREVFGEQPPRASVILDDLRGILSLLAAGGGISAVPSYLAQTYFDAGSLISLTQSLRAPTNTIYLARNTRRTSPAIDMTSDFLHTHAMSW
jgi:DNA-binding transcriptional LysR family regulator